VNKSRKKASHRKRVADYASINEGFILSKKPLLETLLNAPKVDYFDSRLIRSIEKGREIDFETGNEPIFRFFP
jgi:hypothetical protein